jgi:ABC-type bacteriocin/lantibiotic exporter with double-glycine peptidase domain
MIVWYAQQHPASCVAACVRMVLAAFGQTWTEQQVRRIIGHTRLGVTLNSAHAGLIQAGSTALIHDDWGLDDLRDALRRGQNPIVGVERHPLGYQAASHAITLVNLKVDMVEALDPLDGPQPQRYGLGAFELAWKLSGRQALVIECPPQLPSRTV